MKYLQLAYVFAKVGTFSFGGGAPMIIFFQNEIERNNWSHIITDYPTIVAIAQLLPGPFGIDASAYIGYRIAGLLGVAIASIAISLPAFLALIVIARRYNQFTKNKYIQLALIGLRPIIVGLLFSAAYTIQPVIKNTTDLFSLVALKAFLAFILGYILLSKTKISPIVHFSLFAGLGIVLF